MGEKDDEEQNEFSEVEDEQEDDEQFGEKLKKSAKEEFDEHEQGETVRLCNKN